MIFSDRMILASPVLVMFVGCLGDPTLLFTQPVTLHVSDHLTSSEAVDASVEITYRLEADPPQDTRGIIGFEYRRRTTDDSGNVTIDVDIVPVVGEFEPDRDRLTDSRYLVQVTKDDYVDVFPVVMEEGVASKGARFTITVLSIGESRLLQPDEAARIWQVRPLDAE